MGAVGACQFPQLKDLPICTGISVLSLPVSANGTTTSCLQYDFFLPLPAFSISLLTNPVVSKSHLEASYLDLSILMNTSSAHTSTTLD